MIAAALTNLSTFTRHRIEDKTIYALAVLILFLAYLIWRKR